jgi:hypothetical protein
MFCALIAKRMADGYVYITMSSPNSKRVIGNNATKIRGSGYRRALATLPAEIRRYVETGDISIVIRGPCRRTRRAMTPQEVIANDTIEESAKYAHAQTVDRPD